MPLLSTRDLDISPKERYQTRADNKGKITDQTPSGMFADHIIFLFLCHNVEEVIDVLVTVCSCMCASSWT